MPASSRAVEKAFTLVEVIIAVTLAFIVMGATLGFMRMGQQSVVKTSDHADARIECLRLMEIIGWDLDRLIVGDEVDDNLANVLEPFKSKLAANAQEVGFFAFHHYEWSKPLKKLIMIGGWIDYRVVSRQDGKGVDLLRMEKKINRYPLHGVKFTVLDKEEASRLRLMPQHALKVRIEPMGQWDQYNKNIWENAAVTKTFHLRAVEARYACLMSIKKAILSGPPGTRPTDPRFQKIVSLLPDVDTAVTENPVILAWMQPPAVVGPLSLSNSFNDKTADANVEPPTDAPSPSPSPTPIKGPDITADQEMRPDHRNTMGLSCDKCHDYTTTGASPSPGPVVRAPPLSAGTPKPGNHRPTNGLNCRGCHY